MIRVFTNPRYGDQEPDCLTVIHNLAPICGDDGGPRRLHPADAIGWPRPRFARPPHPSSRCSIRSRWLGQPREAPRALSTAARSLALARERGDARLTAEIEQNRSRYRRSSVSQPSHRTRSSSSARKNSHGRQRGSASASRRPGVRSNRLRNASAASSRASGAPRQK
jgi:hypothetical protein